MLLWLPWRNRGGTHLLEWAYEWSSIAQHHLLFHLAKAQCIPERGSVYQIYTKGNES